MLNAVVNSPESKQFWMSPGCLPEEIGIIIDQGQAYCFEGEDIKTHIQRGLHNITVYSLMGLIADIDSGQHQKSHLVSLVNGDYPYLDLNANTKNTQSLTLNQLLQQKASGTYSMTFWSDRSRQMKP